MEYKAFVTGADRGLGSALCSQLLKKGWQVYAGQHRPNWPELSNLANQYPDRLHIIPVEVTSLASLRDAAKLVSATTDAIDLLINNAGVLSSTFPLSLREPLDYSEMMREYNVNSLGPLRVVDAFLALTDRGTLKRICFVSSEAGSIGQAKRTAWYGYCMSKSALNMAAKLIFNQLRPEGYTFRVYHPGWINSYMHGEKELGADLEPEEAAVKAVSFFLRKRNEDRLALVDYLGHTWNW